MWELIYSINALRFVFKWIIGISTVTTRAFNYVTSLVYCMTRNNSGSLVGNVFQTCQSQCCYIWFEIKKMLLKETCAYSELWLLSWLFNFTYFFFIIQIIRIRINITRWESEKSREIWKPAYKIWNIGIESRTEWGIIVDDIKREYNRCKRSWRGDY